MTTFQYQHAGRMFDAIIGTVTGETGLRVFIGPTDPISDAPVVMDFPHHQRHEDETFRFQYIDTGLDTNVVKFALVVPAYSIPIRAPHLLISSSVYNGAARVDVYEGGTYAGGSAMTAFNVNRNGTNTAGMTGHYGVTSTNGTLLPFSYFAGAGVRSGGVSRSSDEIPLKMSTTYRVDFTGLAAGTDGIITFEWYEDLGV